MKQVLFSIILATAASAEAAAELLVRFDDPAVFFPAALGKQVNVLFSAFSDGSAKDRLDRTDFDAVVVSELPEGKVCLFGSEQELDPADSRLADMARTEQGDICVPRSEVSARSPDSRRRISPPCRSQTPTRPGACGAGRPARASDCGARTACSSPPGWWAIYDAAQDLFGLQVDGGEPYPVLRHFHIAPERGPAGLLPELKAKGLVLDDDDCQFSPANEHLGPEGWSFWGGHADGQAQGGVRGAAQGRGSEPPVAKLGYAVDYIGFFMVHRDHPDRLLFVNLWAGRHDDRSVHGDAVLGRA